MSLLRTTALVSGFTLLSRIAGLGRDVVIARAFGAGPLTDAFWVAFRIPNLLRRLFAEGAFSQAFVPILGEAKNRHDDQQVKILLDRVALALFSILLLITLIGVIAAPILLGVMASGLNTPGREATFSAAVTMTRIMFPYILFMSMVALASGILNTWRKFAIPAFTPVLLNLSMIGAAFGLSPYLDNPIYALAIGVMIGGVMQLVIQWVALSKIGLRPRLSIHVSEALGDPTVKRIMRQMLPAIVGVSVAQISLLINMNIATWLTPGSVTWLSFGDRLMEFPTAMIGVALGTVLLPSLSKASADMSNGHYSNLLDWGLKLVLLLGLPAAVTMMLIPRALVSVLFHYGAYQAADVEQTEIAVVAYSVGLIGLLAVKVLAPGYYAQQNIRTPVKIAIYILLATQIMNLIFVPRFAHAGLALSISVAATLNAIALLVGLMRKQVYRPQRGWSIFTARILTALTAMGVCLHLLSTQVDWFSLQSVPLMRIGALALVLTISGSVYLVVLWLVGIKAQDFRRASSI
jgi:putative peptidoglycan lipid II flippase